MSEEMETLDDWKGFEQAQLNAFVDYYRDRMADNPDYFPEMLPAGEFDEQYRIWTES